MDTILSSIISALAAGAAAKMNDIGGDAIAEAYDGLKSLLVKKLGKSGAVVSVEDTPASSASQTTLAEAIASAGLHNDADLESKAKNLIECLKNVATKSEHAGIEIGTIRAKANVHVNDLVASGRIKLGDIIAETGDVNLSNMIAGDSLKKKLSHDSQNQIPPEGQRNDVPASTLVQLSVRNITARGNVNFYVGAKKGRSGPVRFNIPPLVRNYQPRIFDLENLRHKIKSAKPAEIIGLCGMGGVGKTVMASAIATDPNTLADFDDGVAWLNFGENAPPLGKAADLATAITGEATRFDSLDVARGILGDLTRDLSLLIILDDIWEPEAADPFIDLGIECRILITTRSTFVLDRARALRLDVELFDNSAARNLLAIASGVAATKLPSYSDEILRHCGNLPLAIAAVGGLIAVKRYSWAEALEALEDGAGKDLDTSWLREPNRRNVAIVLRLSVEKLPIDDEVDAKSCFLACAVFKEDIVIPEATLLRLWSRICSKSRHAKSALEILKGLGLLLSAGGGGYKIHDLYFDYLRHVASPSKAQHAALLQGYRVDCGADWESCDDDGYILRHLAEHLVEAGSASELRTLAFRLPWLQHKLECTDINAVIADFNFLGGDIEVKTLSAALTLSAHVLIKEKEQLKAQIVSRLTPQHGHSVEELINDIRKHGVFAPLWAPYLTAPGGRLRRFEGHKNSVKTLVSFRKGTQVLSGGEDATIRLWNASTAEELMCFNGHKNSVISITIIAKGQHAVSCSIDRTIRIWNLDTGMELKCISTGLLFALSVAALPCSSKFLAAYSDGTFRMFDSETGEQIKVFKGHLKKINVVVVFPCGKRALTGGDDAMVRLWDLESEKEVRRFEGSSGPVKCIALHPDKLRFVSAGSEPVLRIWEINSGAEQRQLAGHLRDISAVSIFDSGKYIISVSIDQTLRYWNFETGAQLFCINAQMGVIESVVVLPDNKHALCGTRDQSINLLDLDVGSQLPIIHGHDGAVNSVAALLDGTIAISGASDGILRRWDLDKGIQLTALDVGSRNLNSLAISPTGRYAVCGGSGKVLRLWDFEVGAEVQSYRGHTERIKPIAMLSDGNRILSGSGDGTARLWSIDKSEELCRSGSHGGIVEAIGLLPDESGIITASGNRIFLWKFSDKDELKALATSPSPVISIVVHPNGESFFCGCADGTIVMWDIQSGADMHRFKGHMGSVNALLVLSGSDRLLSAGSDGILQLWDIETGLILMRYTGDAAFTALWLVRHTKQVIVGNARGQVSPFAIPD